MFGDAFEAKRSVELTTTWPSNGKNDKATGALPVAKRMLSPSIFVSPPSPARTTTALGPLKRPTPRNESILFFLNRKRTPSVSSLTTLSLHQHRGEIQTDRVNADAVAGESFAHQVIKLAGIEQRLAGDTADVETSPAQARPLFDASDPQAELRGSNRGDIAPRTGADDDQIESICHDTFIL